MKRAVGRTFVFEVLMGVLVAVGVGLVPARAAAQAGECPVDEPVEPAAVGELAAQTFEQGPGAVDAEAIGGLERAEQAVPGAFRGIEGSIAPELSAQGDPSLNEYTAGVSLGVQLGRLGRAKRRAWGARVDERQAERDRRRAEFIYRVQRAFIDWWVAEVERRHLAAYQQEVRAEIEPLREATDTRRFTDLDMADWRVEAGRIGAERIEAKRAASFARADLQELLGVRCRFAAPRSDRGDSDARTNPWMPLLDRVDRFPEVEALIARHERAVREAEVARRDAPVELSVGVGSRSVGLEEFWFIPQIGLSIPLANPSRPEAERSTALAAGLSAERRWRIRRIRGQIFAASSRWQASVEARRQFVDAYIEPLRRRQELFEEALARGGIRLDRLIRARRALHEAEQRLLLLETDLMARRLRADALSKMIQPPREDQ
jgi:hypothetical protein